MHVWAVGERVESSDQSATHRTLDDTWSLFQRSFDRLHQSSIDEELFDVISGFDALSLLAAHGIEELVDVRTIPRSRHNPQYEQATLRQSLKAAHIRYRHLRALGGRRHTHADSPNTGRINASFRGYADYMQTEEFQGGLRRLESGARSSPPSRRASRRDSGRGAPQRRGWARCRRASVISRRWDRVG